MKSFKLRSRQWLINEKGNIIMGEGRMEILENIEKTGSINQTAKLMKMSYKGVWSKIKATENGLNRRLIQTDKRRGSCLTAEGKDLLRKYILLKQRCLEADEQIFHNIFHP